MSFKTTYILFGTFAVLLGFLLLSQKGHKTADNVAYVLPSLHEAKLQAKDIDVVEIVRKGAQPEHLKFLRGERGWQLEQPAVRASHLVVDELVNQVLRAAKETEDIDLPSSLQQAGLVEPSIVVTLKKGAEKAWQLHLGDKSPGSDDSALVYVTSSDFPKEVMAVRLSQLDRVYKAKPISEFRSRDLLSEGVLNFADAVTQLKIEPDKGPAIVLDKIERDRWKFQQPPLGDADAGGESVPGPDRAENRQSGVRGLLLDLAGLRVETDADFVADDVSDLEKYGLGDKPSFLRVEIQRRLSGLNVQDDNRKLVDDALLIGNKVDDKGETRYARLESEKSVVRLPFKKLLTLYEVTAHPSSIRNRDLVAIDSRSTDAIDIQNSHGTIQLRRAGRPETWKLYQGDKKIAEAEWGAVQDLLKALNTKKQVKEFIDAPKNGELGLDKPSAVVSIWFSGLKKDEDHPDAVQLKDAKPTIKLTFGKKMKDLVYVQREVGNDKSVVAVADTLLKPLSEGILAYRDRTLPSFSEKANVVKVALRRGRESFVFEKDKFIWTLKEPKDLAGRKADGRNVERILSELRRLRTEKLIAEKATDLAPYGLKEPQAEVVVTVKKGEKETEQFAYLFGKDAEGGLFAKQGQRDMVFVAPLRDIDAVLHAELQDPTVFQIDAGKIRAVKLSGWRKLGIGTQVLELEKSADKGWTAKTPADFNLDREQADAFVSGLASLAAERFAVRNSGPKPEHKLDAKDRSLLVEITVEGDKAPLTLALGHLDDKAKAYFATSSTLAKDVFLLPQSRFEKLLKDGIKYFSKDPGKK